MFKKKPIYIIGIIVFTLILIADLALFFLVPTGGGRGNMPNSDGSFEAGAFSGELPEGFDAEGFGGQKPDMGSMDLEALDGQLPESMKDAGDMPYGGWMPGGSEDATMPADFDSSRTPEGLDRSDMPGRDQLGSTQRTGILSVIRSAFWPILIICILGDALCVFMLIRISKKKEINQQENDEDDDAPPHRDHTNTVLAVIAVILVGAVSITSLPSSSGTGALEAERSIEQQTAAMGDIASVFSGSGTLQSSDAEAVDIPVSVSVTSYTVKNGSYVEAGQTIATVDKTSVLNAIYEVQSLIAEMDGEIAAVKDDTLDSTITARADGRIKAIYVSEGDSVSNAMYEHGAVMLISLGGSMTVEIESDAAVAVGQALTVTLSDATQIEGKVQQVRSGRITITTTDDGPTPGDAVSVAAEDGTLLGTGTLEVSSPLKVTGYWGTVSQIRVTLDQKVTTGTTLVTLSDTQDLSRYQQLLREREELTELAAELNQMYLDGCIKASSSGIISNIRDDVDYSELSSPASLSSSGSYEIMLLSNIVMDPVPTEPAAEETIPDGEAPEPPAETTDPAEPTAPPTEPEEPPTPEGISGTFAGKVTKVAYGAFWIQICETDLTGSTAAALETMDDALFTTSKEYAPSLSVPVNVYQDGQSSPSSVSAIQAGDLVLLHIENGEITQIDYVPGSGSGNEGPQQMPSSGGSSFSYQQPTTGSEEEETAVYEVETASVCTITPAQTMTVDVSVDELDILALEVGQTATITLDALPGQSFSGAVRRISPTGTMEDGGSTKYIVTMELSRTEQMLDGMNASVTIEVSRLENVLTVPAQAVYEDGTRTYVYTALDTESGEPTLPVDVVTGASDGTVIQILSGLSDGDTVYYTYADSIVYRSRG